MTKTKKDKPALLSCKHRSDQGYYVNRKVVCYECYCKAKGIKPGKKPTKLTPNQRIEKLIHLSSRMMQAADDHIVAAADAISYARVGTSKVRLEQLFRALDHYNDARELIRLVIPHQGDTNAK